jgi:hypothetical protein
MTGGPTRILIADDQDNVRGAFRIILDAQPDMTVIAEAGDGVAALEQAHHLRRTWYSPTSGCPGWTASRSPECSPGHRSPIPSESSSSPRSTSTTTSTPRYETAPADSCSNAPAPHCSPRRCARPCPATPSSVRRSPYDCCARCPRHRHRPAATRPSRSPIASSRSPAWSRWGHTNAEIATVLFISPGTVKNHVAGIQRKLGARNRVGIAAWAWATGHAAP